MVDYTKGHLGYTHLESLEGLPLFVDGLYIYGYLHKADRVSRKEKNTKKEVCLIQACVLQAIGNRHVSTSNKISVECLEKIQQIEKMPGREVLSSWKKLWIEDEPGEYIVAKVDVSEMDIEELHHNLPLLERLLHNVGYGIYCIDYTQDFSGTMVCKNLIEHLQTKYGIEEESGEENVLSWISTEKGYTTKTEIYNKIVSNIEGRKTQFGGQLAYYVECPNKHLGNTFAHTDVQARGCTRIKVSIYTYQGEIEFAKELLHETIEKTIGDKNFVVQPGPMQWKNIAKELDRCCIVANLPKRDILVGWYANTKTRKIGGTTIHICSTQDWERCILWTIAEFGFRHCPIFRIDILSTTDTDVDIGKLQCYTKTGDTTLASSTKPTKAYKDVQNNLQEFLPETDTILWKFRNKKIQSIGTAKQKCPLISVDTTREISITGRETKIFAMLDKIEREKIIAEIEVEQKKLTDIKKQEIETLAKTTQRYIDLQKRKSIYKNTTGYIQKLPPNTEIEIVARKKYRETYKVVDTKGNVYWATKKLSAYLDTFVDLFAYDILEPQHVLRFCTSEIKSLSTGDKTIEYVDVECIEYPKLERLEQTVADIEKSKEVCTTLEDRIGLEELPDGIDTRGTNIVDIPPGQYIAYRFAQRIYRGSLRTTLFLHKANIDWTIASKKEIKTCGYFLQTELEKIDLHTTIYIQLYLF
jgi:hypothetical protein